MASPESILVVDIGGSKIKILASGHTEPVKLPSGKKLKPGAMVEAIRELAKPWNFDAVSIGFPGLVGEHGPRAEPPNLGAGWVGFDFAAAFERPVRIINDAALQALGSYEGGRMLFLSLGTGLGSTLVAGNVLVPLELGHLTCADGQPLHNIAGADGLKTLGKKEWRRLVRKMITNLMDAFSADYVTVGGGNARKASPLPSGARLGHNLAAFRGGIRLWHIDQVRTQTTDGTHLSTPATMGEWKLI
ncbi:MAG: ROK family protein [Gemmataceae bacterium]|nr:ROK family protein [Gemmataceae bacterium]